MIELINEIWLCWFVRFLGYDIFIFGFLLEVDLILNLNIVCKNIFFLNKE